MTKRNDEELREIALHIAVNAAQGSGYKNILEHAQNYYEFLREKKEKYPPKDGSLPG